MISEEWLSYQIGDTKGIITLTNKSEFIDVSHSNSCYGVSSNLFYGVCDDHEVVVKFMPNKLDIEFCTSRVDNSFHNHQDPLLGSCLKVTCRKLSTIRSLNKAIFEDQLSVFEILWDILDDIVDVVEEESFLSKETYDNINLDKS